MSGGNPTDKLNRINSQQQYDVVPGPVGQPFSGEALTMDSCKLTWSSPEDNGGSAITNYIIEKRESDPMGWTSVSYTGTGNNTVVQGLIDGKGYFFRIAAKNIIGMGPFIETDKMVLITEPNSVPKPPEKLEVKAITKESVTVAWRTPEYDGGCEVTGYVLEASLQGKDHFSRVGADSDLLEKTFTHAGLKKGSSYEFRVAAVNKVGQGRFSFVTKPVQCKDELVPPEIDLDASVKEKMVKEKMVLHAGKTIRIIAHVSGKPAPTITWTHDDAEVPAEEVVETTVETTGISTSLVIKNCKRTHQGKYTLIAKNEGGERKKVIIVEVLDVPGPVGQPFSGEALTKDSCKLTWSSPEDNGGSAITNYIIEKRESDPIGWTSVSYTGTGNNTVVQGLIDGKGYVFRIAAKNVIGMGPFIETDKMVLITEPNSVPKPPEKLEVKAITKESVTVAWRTPEYDGGCEVTGYVLEASLQGKDHFSRVGADSDLLEKTFTHAGLKKGSSYEFRVAAVNKVGQGSFSFVTKPVQCKDELGKLLNFFVVKTGETCGAHETFVKKLKLKGQIQKKSVDQSDYILAFCPSPSRTGTDVQEAMGKIPRGKPVILVVMHHRHDVEAYLDDSSRHVSREDVILTVDTLFWEGAFLTCSHNKKAFSKVLNAVGPSSSILRFFGETFGEKRLSNMDVPSSNSPGEPTTSSSENKNRKRDTESKVKTPWRDANFENKDILLKSVKEFHPENKHVRILLLGPKDSGKSSFINSVSSILRGRMVHGEPVDPIDKTIKYQTHTIKKGNKQKQNYPFVFNDIMGLGSETGVLEEDMKLSLEGHVKDGYTFNPALPLSKEDPDYYKKKNTPEDKTHVLVLVIPADQVTTSSPDSMKKMKDIAVNMGIPQICILTKIDEASSLVKENGVKHVYNSKNLQEKMEEVSAKVGIPMESIFPVKNYHEETDLDDDIDVLILTALQHMIDLGKTYTDSMSLE